LSKQAAAAFPAADAATWNTLGEWVPGDVRLDRLSSARLERSPSLALSAEASPTPQPSVP
jgi:hypothetical protein